VILRDDKLRRFPLPAVILMNTINRFRHGWQDARRYFSWRYFMGGGSGSAEPSARASEAP